MPRNRKFTPPAVTSPPTLVVVEWIDSATDSTDDRPAAESGGLVLLPSVGFHVRTGADRQFGKFIVLAREYTESQGHITVRDTHTIPTGWIRKWSAVENLTTIYPPEKP